MVVQDLIDMAKKAMIENKNLKYFLYLTQKQADAFGYSDGQLIERGQVRIAIW